MIFDTMVAWTSKSTRQRGAAAVLLCFFLASCAPSVNLIPDQTPAPRDSRWEKLSGGHQVKRSLQAMADIDLITFGGRRHLRVAILLQLPSLMRMESIPVFGPPDFFLSLNREKLKIFLPGKNDFYQGYPSRENLSRFLPISLSPTDMVYVLLGLPPPPPSAAGGKIGYRESGKGDEKRLDVIFNSQIIRTLLSDGKIERLTNMEITDRDAESQYQVSYGNYLRLEEHDMPQQVTIISKDGDAQIIVHYDEMELSAPGDQEVFDLPIPRGITPTSLERDKTPGDE